MPPCSSLFLNARSCSSNTQTPLPTCSPTHDLSPCPPRASALSASQPLTYTMVKEKNHTNRNQSYKAHRRGIKKVKPQRYRSLRGVSVLESEREVERERAWLRTRATRAAGYGRRFFLWIGNRVRYRRGAAALPRLRSRGKQQQQHGMVATGLRPHPRARAKHGGRAWLLRGGLPYLGGCRRLTCVRGIGPRTRTGSSMSWCAGLRIRAARATVVLLPRRERRQRREAAGSVSASPASVAARHATSGLRVARCARASAWLVPLGGILDALPPPAPHQLSAVAALVSLLTSHPPLPSSSFHPFHPTGRPEVPPQRPFRRREEPAQEEEHPVNTLDVQWNVYRGWD